MKECGNKFKQIDERLNVEEWQIKAIQKGIKSLDEGKYITHEELRKKRRI